MKRRLVLSQVWNIAICVLTQLWTWTIKLFLIFLTDIKIMEMDVWFALLTGGLSVIPISLLLMFVKNFDRFLGEWWLRGVSSGNLVHSALAGFLLLSGRAVLSMLDLHNNSNLVMGWNTTFTLLTVPKNVRAACPRTTLWSRLKFLSLIGVELCEMLFLHQLTWSCDFTSLNCWYGRLRWSVL